MRPLPRDEIPQKAVEGINIPTKYNLLECYTQIVDSLVSYLRK